MKKVTKVLAYIILAVVSFGIGYYLSYTLAEKEKKIPNTKKIANVKLNTNKNK